MIFYLKMNVKNLFVQIIKLLEFISFIKVFWIFLLLFPTYITYEFRLKFNYINIYSLLVIVTQVINNISIKTGLKEFYDVLFDYLRLSYIFINLKLYFIQVISVFLLLYRLFILVKE